MPDVWKESLLLDILNEVLGPQCGLVRVLYFNYHLGNNNPHTN